MLILIHGEDTFSSKEYLSQIIEQFKQKHDPAGNAVAVFDSEEHEWESVLEALSADGLFSAKKLVIGKGLTSHKLTRESLASYLDSPGLSESTVLVLYEAGAVDKRTKLAKRLMKEKYSREFSVADEYAMQQLIQRRARELGKQIEPEALRALSGLVGTDVWRARNEIEKLAHLVADIITANDVRAHTYAFGEEKIWEFIDSLSGGNRARAFFLLEQQFSQGIKPMYLLSMLIRQVRLMMAMFGAPGNDSSLASSLDLHPFVVKKTRLGASKFSLAQLKTMYQALSRLDSALKTGRGEPKLLFTILVDSIVR